MNEGMSEREAKRWEPRGAAGPPGRGFTLIELLVVVAVIAILAAIALPNFLEAQTRAKVARVQSDLRTIATGLEAYAVNANRPPPCIWPDSGFGNDYAQDFAYRLNRLSTPVAYLTTIPTDSPFRAKGGREYYEQQGVAVRGGSGDEVAADGFFMLCAGRPVVIPSDPVHYFEGPLWVLLDAGPDASEPWQLIGADYTWTHALVFYDPSNGTLSRGDLYRSPVKSSFP